MPAEALSWKEAYTLLTETIAPRPIAFVSTVSKEGVANLAPFSFFIVGGANPPSLAFSPVVNGTGGEKDSLRNVRDTGEFVVNLVHREMAEGMNQASASLPPHHSEWDVCNFATLPSERIRPARVAESRVQFECRLFQIVEHGDGPGAARYVIGEVVMVHVAAALIKEGKVDAMAVESIARLGGPHYIDMGNLERFELKRP